MANDRLLSEERIAELAAMGNSNPTIQSAIRTAIREAGEAAAKVCESYVWFNDGNRSPDEGNLGCAAEIRRRL